MGRLRKGYKQTEIGVIPLDWNASHVKDFSQILTGGTPSTSVPEFWGGNILWMSSGELNEKYVRDVAGRITQCGVDNSSTRPIPSHCVLIGLAGQVKTRGTVAINLVELCTNQSIAAILPSSKHNPFYLYHSIDSKYNELRELSTGDGGRGGLNKKLLENLLVALPSPEEQKAIAEVLNDIDSLIEALDKKIAKKRAIREGAMQQLLTGKKRLNGFTEPWMETKLGTISMIKTGSRNGDESVENGLYPFFVRSQIVHRINSYSFDGEAILVPGDGGIGDIFHYVNGKFDYHQRVYKISDFVGSVDCKFVFYYLKRYFGSYALQQTAKATVDSLRLPTFTDFPMLMPKSLAEQNAVAQILTDMDNEIGQLENERQKYTSLKQGAMQQLLTGQIRLIAGSKAQIAEKQQKQANTHFKRSVWAAEIVDRLFDEPTFGHVKMEKMIFLTEHMCGVDIGSNYHRDAAGPYDNRAIRSIDSQLKKQNWFEVIRQDKGYRYIPMIKRGGHRDYFDRYYSEVQAIFDRVINTCRSWNTERCEIVATLYSAWKDLGNSGQQYTDGDIINEVINNWNESKKRIPEERWQNALNWMRENDFAPKFT
jgi:type I restriction enzyme S subunit